MEHCQFFNSGLLFDSDDLLKQLLVVITACELVGLQVKLQISDAGGANARMLALLTKTFNQKCLPGENPSKDQLSYTNPMDTRRCIWVSLCSVHSLKNHKNMLVGRSCLHNEGKLISWNVVKLLYHMLNDDVHGSLNVHAMRGIKRSVSCPDSYTQ